MKPRKLPDICPVGIRNGNFEESILFLVACSHLLYRVCISPLTPPSCRFTPTCSAYAVEAIKKHGPVKGLYLAVRRILRCHPGVVPVMIPCLETTETKNRK